MDEQIKHVDNLADVFRDLIEAALEADDYTVIGDFHSPQGAGLEVRLQILSGTNTDGEKIRLQKVISLHVDAADLVDEEGYRG